MPIIESVSISTYDDTEVDLDDGSHFTIFPPIEGDVNVPWKFAIGGLKAGLKVTAVKCRGENSTNLQDTENPKII